MLIDPARPTKWEVAGRRFRPAASTFLAAAIIAAAVMAQPTAAVASEAYAAPATGPEMEAGVVARLGASTPSPSNGVSILDGYAYTAVGTRILKTNVSTGETTTLAGQSTAGCDSGQSGITSKFYNPRVIGNDGSLIYVADPVCEVRTISPDTGATTYKWMIRGEQYALAGRLGFSINGDGHLYTTDLRTGAVKDIASGIAASRTALAADENFAWLITDRTLRRISLTGGVIEDVRLPLPFGVSTTLLSVGPYLYTSAWNNFVFRISKADASTQFIAGDTAHNDSVLTTINGLAADGTKLYVSDNDGLAAISSGSRTYAPTAVGELVDYASMVTTATLPGQHDGVTSIGDHVYTASAQQILKTNTTTGTTAVLAGGQSATGCTDGGSGTTSGFSNPRVIGHDGSLVYVADCQVRTVNPVGGATRTLPATSDQGVVAGGKLFTLSGGELRVRNLKSGVSNLVVRGVSPWSAMTADAEYIWLITDRRPGQYSIGLERLLIRITLSAVAGMAHDDPIGVPEVITSALPASAYGQLISIGDYLYAETFPQNADDGTPQPPRLTAISKDGGVSTSVRVQTAAGNYASPWNGTIGGLATDGDNIFTLDRLSTTTDVKRIHREPPHVATDWRNFVRTNTALIPTNNMANNNILGDGPRLFWNPATGLCETECAGIHQWRQNMYEAKGSGTLWQAVSCTLEDWQAGAENPEDPCTPEDFERDLIAALVKDQGKFNPDGSTTSLFEQQVFLELCNELAANMDHCAVTEFQAQIDNATTIAELLSAVPPFLNGRGGQRQPEEITDNGVDHSWSQHAYGSGYYYNLGAAANRGNIFRQEITKVELRKFIEDATLRGIRRKRDSNDVRDGYYRDWDTGTPLSLDGRQVIRLVFGSDGKLITAFPFAP